MTLFWNTSGCGYGIRNVRIVDGGLNLAHTLVFHTLSVHEVVRIAKKYKAELTPDRHICWTDTLGWTVTKQLRLSVMDALIIEYACNIGPRYLDASSAATGWNCATIHGFLEIMLTGRPFNTTLMYNESRHYWQAILIGLLVYPRLRRL